MKGLFLTLALLSNAAMASIFVTNQSGTNLGSFNRIQCGAGMTCTKSSGNLLIRDGLVTQVTSTTTTLTSSQCGATVISDSADVITLPEASTVLGCRFSFVCGTADDFDVNPNDGTDQISVVNSVAAGTGAAITPSAGDAIRCTDIGSSITLEAVGNNLWAAIGVANGAWTDVN